MNAELGGPEGFGEGVFSIARLAAGNADDGSVYIDVTSVFGSAGMNIFGTSYSGLYLNSNGLITFEGPNTNSSGSGLDALSEPAIAPFWTDHNIAAGGELYWDIDPNAGTVTLTWYKVKPYSGSGKNSYQVVLSDSGNGDFDLQIVYDKIGWTSGDSNQTVTGITDGSGYSQTLQDLTGILDLDDFEHHQFHENAQQGTFQARFENGVPDYSDGVVSGSVHDDSFGLSLLDANGDAITLGADSVLAGGGNDKVDASDGDDTVHGGAGSDTIRGGEGRDEIYGDGLDGATADTSFVSITQSNYWDTSSGFTVTASNVVGGALSSATVRNVGTDMGGFGASGTVSDSDSGIQQQTGFDLASGLSEELSIAFDSDIDAVSFSFLALFSDSYGEQAQWALYNDGTQIAQSTFTEIGAGSGTGTIDLAGYGSFDQLVFTSLAQTDGSDGSDFFITEVRYASAPAGAVFADSIDGGAGTDTIYGGLGADTVLGGSGADTIYGEQGDDSIDGGNEDDIVLGGEGDDTLIGGAGGDTLSGGLGDDLIEGGEGDDLLTTGLGQDTLLGGEGDDTLKNSAGNDSLVGGVGNDSIVATIGDDTLEGGEGDDTLIGGIDDDSLDGGAGNDSLTGDFGDGGLYQPNQLFAYEYYELDDAVSLTSLADAGFTSGQDNDNPPDGQGAVDSFDLAAIDAQHGGNGDSFAVKLVTTLTVTSGGTYTFDLSSDDGAQVYVNGALVADNDGIQAGTFATGATNLAAGEHLIEIIYFEQAGDETLIVELSGPDTRGNPFPLQETAIATSFNDTIEGGSGSDTIEGGLGDDSLSGGDDADVFVITDASGNDTIAGGEGGADDDLLDMSAVTFDINMRMEGSERGYFEYDGTVSEFSQIERIIFGEGDDQLSFGVNSSVPLKADGRGGNDTLLGSNQSDSFRGGSGDDRLIGNGGDDTLDGGTGNDTLAGGSGDDLLNGGAGDDVFEYRPGDGNDTITDFNFGNSGALDDGSSRNNDFINLSGYYDHISELYADQADDGVLNQSNQTDTRGQTTNYSDNSQFGDGSLRMQGASADNSSFTEENTGVACFVSGTLIATPAGDVPVEALGPGDLVHTLDHGPQPVRWASCTRLGPDELMRNPKVRPVFIKRGVLGAARDLLVSPQHGILLGSNHLARATHLARYSQGIRVAHGKRHVTYYHLMFDRHQIIWSEGVPSESFYPGPLAIGALSAMERLLLDAAFSCRDTPIGQSYGPRVRPFLTARECKVFVASTQRRKLMRLCPDTSAEVAS